MFNDLFHVSIKCHSFKYCESKKYKTNVKRVQCLQLVQSAAAIFSLGRVNMITTHQTLLDDSKVENFFATDVSSWSRDSIIKYLDQ